MKIGEWKEKLFFCNLSIKDQCFLHSYYLYNDKKIYKFKKKIAEMRKNVCAFLIKNTFICWTRLKTAKPSATAKQLIKGALSDLRQFLATEVPLTMVKNTFCFTSKALFVLKIFRFLSWLFGQVSKRLDEKDKVNFKFYDITAWLANNRNTHIA